MYIEASTARYRTGIMIEIVRHQGGRYYRYSSIEDHRSLIQEDIPDTDWIIGQGEKPLSGKRQAELEKTYQHSCTLEAIQENEKFDWQ